jgi:two-component system nitrate/nitrite response regulator NarL
MKLLVADDHDMFLEMLSAALRRRGHDVVATTETLDDIVDLVATTGPELCLLDLWFGQDTALTAARRLREEHPGVRIVLLTGEQPDEAVGILQEGVVDAVAGKLWTLDRIDQLLHSVRDGRQVRRVVGTEALVEATPPGDRLTEREQEVLRLLATGACTTEIGDALGVSTHTVRTHIRSLLSKLSVHSRVEALRVAYDRGLVTAGR